ncbi:hypothetical protein ABW21_db0208278 [Orbilia brochopaga]|nr:hypothetical protein ABW21_db0208278 [Drechslerella brochopaga]
MLVTSTALLLVFACTFWPASAWYQTFSTDAADQLHLRTHQYEDENCVTRPSLWEGVLGIMNIVGSRQLHAEAFYIGGGCERDHPDEYSLFIHFYDEKQAIQLVDLAIPGLDHSWSGFRGIDPDSKDWESYGIRNANNPRSAGSAEWYEPRASGRTLIGEYYADLLEEVPPGSIRYRVSGTSQYLTVHNVVKVIKERNGKPLLPNAEIILTPDQIREAIEELRYTVRLFYAETGGRDRHSAIRQQLEMNEAFRQEFRQKPLSQLLDPNNWDPRLSIVTDMMSKSPGQSYMQSQIKTSPNMNMNQPPISDSNSYSPFRPQDIYAPDPFQDPRVRSADPFLEELTPLPNTMKSEVFDWASYIYSYRPPTKFNPELVSEVIGDITREFNRITNPQQYDNGFAVPRPRTNVFRSNAGLIEQIPQNTRYPPNEETNMQIEEEGSPQIISGEEKIPRQIGFEEEYAAYLEAEREALLNQQLLDRVNIIQELGDEDYYRLLDNIDFESLANQADMPIIRGDSSEASQWPSPQIYIEDQQDVFVSSPYFEEESQGSPKNPWYGR